MAEFRRFSCCKRVPARLEAMRGGREAGGPETISYSIETVLQNLLNINCVIFVAEIEAKRRCSLQQGQLCAKICGGTKLFRICPLRFSWNAPNCVWQCAPLRFARQRVICRRRDRRRRRDAAASQYCAGLPSLRFGGGRLRMRARGRRWRRSRSDSAGRPAPQPGRSSGPPSPAFRRCRRTCGSLR